MPARISLSFGAGARPSPRFWLAFLARLAFASMAFASMAFAAFSISPFLSARAQEGLEPLTIVLKSNEKRPFQVEVMRSDVERARGLMHRRHLPADRGMLFDFKRVQPVSMWMKNTFIPLDMIFIARDGVIVSIAENAEPLSERIIVSGGPVYSVLEINGGLAAKLGIAPGDKVLHGLFAP